MLGPDTFRHSGCHCPSTSGEEAQYACSHTLTGRLASLHSHLPAPCLPSTAGGMGLLLPRGRALFPVCTKMPLDPPALGTQAVSAQRAASPAFHGPSAGPGVALHTYLPPNSAGGRPEQGPCVLFSMFPGACAEPGTQLVLDKYLWEGGETRAERSGAGAEAFSGHKHGRVSIFSF